MPIGVGVDVSVKRGLDVVVLDERRRLREDPRARQTPGDLERLLRVVRPVLPGRPPEGPYPRAGDA